MNNKPPVAKQKKKRRGLGSLGVDALLTTQIAHETTVESNEEVLQVTVKDIQPSRYQPRKHIEDDTLHELANSISQQGLIQPIVIRKQSDGTGKYELVAGERRWRAAQLAGLETIPALLRTIDENTAATFALVENIQREDLSPLEEATAIQQLIIKFDLTHEQVATAIGRSRPAVSNLLRLLELAPEVRTLLLEGRLDMGHARVLLQLNKEKQTVVADLIVARQMSVREVELYVKEILEDKKKHQPPKQAIPKTSPEITQLERQLSEHLGAPVKLKHNQTSGNGSLAIHYASLDELDNILDKILKNKLKS